MYLHTISYGDLMFFRWIALILILLPYDKIDFCKTYRINGFASSVLLRSTNLFTKLWGSKDFAKVILKNYIVNPFKKMIGSAIKCVWTLRDAGAARVRSKSFQIDRKGANPEMLELKSSVNLTGWNWKTKHTENLFLDRIFRNSRSHIIRTGLVSFISAYL